MEFARRIDSKFRFILVAAKRARQLQAGAKPLVQTLYKKMTKIAQMEVEAGLVPIEVLEVANNIGNGDEKSKKARAGK
ncbi:MAG: DNA-directed RNA polymerase subunit omega [Acidobacteria bacterium]|nr:DNA-directed RNA polymerase subunit omega [Acidobacteriota bacterium]MBI1982954.1 DNA-directed RNA polymerase subunit omega [Acidobacteriota bacterium]